MPEPQDVARSALSPPLATRTRGGSANLSPYNAAHRSPGRPGVRRLAPADETPPVNVEEEVIRTLRSVLSLQGVAAEMNAGTALLGSVAELDSMAVVSVLTSLEERFGFTIDDDEIDGRTFASVGSLTSFVRSKLGQ